MTELTARIADRGVALSWRCSPGTAREFRVERHSDETVHVLLGGWLPADVVSAGSPGAYLFLDLEGRPGNAYSVSVKTEGRTVLDAAQVVVAQASTSLDSSPRTSSTGQPGERARIAITESGLYYLTATRLAESLAGMNGPLVEQFIRETNFTMHCQGQPVSWFSDTNGSGVYFFAEATNNRYTSENIYWIMPGPGTLMSERIGAGPAPGETNLYYSLAEHYEEDLLPWLGLFTESEDDFWLWTYFFGTATSSFSMPVDALPVDSVSGVATGLLTVAFKGGTALAAFDPEHSAAVYLNDVLVASNQWNDHARWVMQEAVTNIQPGANTLMIKSHKLPGMGQYDYAYYGLESYGIVRQRFYSAVNDELSAPSPSNQTVLVQGFSTNDVHVLDITDPALPVRIRDVTIDMPTGSAHRVSFDATAGHDYYLASSLAVKTPDQVTGRTPMDLLSVTNRADHVIIAAPGFETACEVLAEHRRSQGLDAMIVPIGDVFDLFSHGLFTPWAVRAFVQYAVANWEDVPRYVVLAGSGSWDYKNVYAKGDCIIPATSANAPGFGLRNSDAPLADISGGPAPEIAIGRLHCQSVAELEGAIAKIIAFERGGTWRGTVQFNAGVTDPAAGNFTNTCNQVAANVTTNYVVDKNYAATQSLAVAKARMKTALNTGAYVICYYGHGNPDQLGYNSLDTYLQKGDRSSITNRTAPPLMFAMTCDFADFGVPGLTRLGESLVGAATGVAGLWGCVGPTYNDLSEYLGKTVASRIFKQHDVRIGDAICASLAAYEKAGLAPYVMDVMCYHGDPATLLPSVPASYEVWRSEVFSTNDAANPAVSGRGVDSDGDGIVNDLEFLWDLDPTVSNDVPPFSARIVSVGAPPGSGTTNDFATLTFNRRLWLEGVDLRVEKTHDLVGGIWTSGPGVSDEVAVTNLTDVIEQVTVRMNPSLVADFALFVRLVMETID